MVDKVEAPDPTTVVFRLKFATSAFLPALADPYAWIYKKEILDKDPHWYEKNIMGSGPFKFVGYEIGQSIKGDAQPRLLSQGPALSRRLRRRSSPPSRRCASTRSAPTARPWSSAACRRRRATSSCKELGDKITVQTERLELRQPDHARTTRRSRSTTCGCAARWRWRSTAGTARRRSSKIATVHTVGGIVFPGSPLAATKEELQQIAGFWPDIEKSRAEAKRLLKEAGRRGSQIRADEPQRRPALQVRRHLGDRRVEQDRPEGHAARAADRSVLRRAAQRHLRRDRRLQLPGRGQPADGHRQVPAALGLRRELRRLRGPEGDRPLSTRCCTRPTRPSSAR